MDSGPTTKIMSESWPSLSAPNEIISQLVINLLRAPLKKKQNWRICFHFTHRQHLMSGAAAGPSWLSRSCPQPVRHAWDVSAGSVLAAAAGNAETDKKGVSQGRRGVSVFVRAPDSPRCGRQNFQRRPSAADGGRLLCGKSTLDAVQLTMKQGDLRRRRNVLVGV